MLRCQCIPVRWGPRASPLTAYKLITSKDPEIRSWMDQMNYMMVPKQSRRDRYGVEQLPEIQRNKIRRGFFAWCVAQIRRPRQQPRFYHAFVNSGGKILSWGRSTDLLEGTLKIHAEAGPEVLFVLPFRNISSELRKQGLYYPETLIAINWKQDHPLTLGMENHTDIFYRGNPVFKTSIPGFEMYRRVIGRFPEENLIMSGYAEHIKLVANKPIMVWLRRGKGQMVLYGFSPIFRDSTPVTYKLVFNALFL